MNYRLLSSVVRPCLNFIPRRIRCAVGPLLFALIAVLSIITTAGAQNCNSPCVKFSHIGNISITSCVPCVQVIFNGSATDTCCANGNGAVNLNYFPTNGTCFPQGTTTVTAVGASQCGDCNMTTFTVTVYCPPPPECTNTCIQFKGVTNLVVPSCSNCAPVQYPAISISDTCCTNPNPLSASFYPTNGSCFPPGTNSVTIMATDACGFCNITNFTVTVECPPSCANGCIQFLSVSNLVISNCTGNCVQVTYPVTAIDTCCAISGGVTLTFNPPSGSCFSNGTTVVTVQATNVCGDCGSTNFTVSVQCPPPCGTIYVGNSLVDPTNGDQDYDLSPLVILGEYSATSPLSSSAAADTLVSGNIQDVKFYGGALGYDFTLYALSYVGNGPTANSQTFQVVASQSFAGPPTTAGLQTLYLPNPSAFTVNAGDLIAFNGWGPYYSQFLADDELNSDATYESSTNSGSFVAAPPGGAGAEFTVGLNGNASVTYDYIQNIYTNQGRNYAFGVDVASNCPCTNCSCTNSCIQFSAVSNIVVSSCSNCAQVFYSVSASDTCCSSNLTLTYFPPSGTCFPGNSTTPVTVTAEDACGHCNTTNFLVTVECRPCNNGCIQFLNTGNLTEYSCSNCLAVYYPLSAFDPCCNNSNVTLTFEPPNGSCLPQGATVVSCTATDACGNCATTNFTVLIECQACTNPCIKFSGVSNVFVTSCSNCVTVPFPAISTIDTCIVGGGSTTLTFDPPQDYCFPPGTTEVTCWATDAGGHCNTTNFTVTVQCPGACTNSCVYFIDVTNVVVNSCSNCMVVPSYPIAAIAVCCGNNTNVSLSFNPPAGTCFPQGTTQVTCTGVDDCGHCNTTNFTVTVQCPGACTNSCVQFLNATNIVEYSCSNCVAVTYPATAIALCCGNNTNVTLTFDPPSGTCFPEGITQVTALGVDECGNCNTTNFTVTVQCCVPAPANLVLWLPFDETNGPISANLAMPFDPGLQINNPTPFLGAFVDNSLTFNGSNYVTVPDYPAIEIGTNSLTIDAWVLDSGTSAGNSVIVDKRAATGGGYSLWLSPKNGLTLIMGANQFVEGHAIAGGVWHFVAVSVNQGPNGQAFFYVDGLDVKAFNPPIVNLATGVNLQVARTPLGDASSWIGNLDEVEIFNRALSTNELNTIFNAGPTGKCKPCCYLKLLTISRVSPNSVQVNWGACGTLESATSVTGPWTPIPAAASPYVIPATGTAMYYKLVCPPQ